jgi:hypothetical protein
VIHPDGNIWMVDVALARDTGQPVTMPDEKAEAVATDTARPRRCAGSASPRRPDRVRRNQLLSPGDPQHCASQGVQPPVAMAHTGKLTSAALRGLATTGQRCFSAPAKRLRINHDILHQTEATDAVGFS